MEQTNKTHINITEKTSATVSDHCIQCCLTQRYDINVDKIYLFSFFFAWFAIQQTNKQTKKVLYIWPIYLTLSTTTTKKKRYTCVLCIDSVTMCVSQITKQNKREKKKNPVIAVGWLVSRLAKKLVVFWNTWFWKHWNFVSLKCHQGKKK